jgi:hypothetical protein
MELTSSKLKRNGKIIETVTKADLLAADDAELESIVKEEEKMLDIQKAALVPHLAWHFSDAGFTFDAKIQDPDLWAKVERGDRFGYGDRMHVILKTEATRDSSGSLKRERTIPKVFGIERAKNSQTLIWEDDPRI